MIYENRSLRLSLPCSSVSATKRGGPAKICGGGRAGGKKESCLYTVYVLKSQKNGKRYVGITGESLEVRLAQHRSGSTQWTRQNDPFEIIYQETFPDKVVAVRRERFLKTGQGRKAIEHLSKQVAL